MRELTFRAPVPNSVVVLARHLMSSLSADHSFFECCERLQTPEMDRIWRLLLESKPIEGAASFLESALFPEVALYDLKEMSIPEKACAAVFYYCVIAHKEFGSANFIKEREAKIDRYLIANDVLREFIDDKVSVNDPRFEPDLPKSLEMSAAFVVQRFRDLLYSFDPAAVKNNGSSAPLRSALRTVAFITLNVYGKAKYDLLATIGNVLFGHEHALTGQAVKNWFKDLRPSDIPRSLDLKTVEVEK